MIYEKPVLQLGKSILSNKDIVYEIENLNQSEIIGEWVNKENFSNKLSKYELFMSYLIENELSFFIDECFDMGFNNHTFFQKKILDKVDLNRKGNYPNKFIESRFKSETLILENIGFTRLFYLNVQLIKELLERGFKRINKYFIK